MRWRVVLSLDLDPSITAGVPDNFIGHLLDVVLDCGIIESSADQSLGGEDSVLGVGDGLPLGGSTDDSLTLISEGNDRRSGSGTFRVFNNFGGAAFHDSNTGVGGSEIYTDYGSGLLGGEGWQQ